MSVLGLLVGVVALLSTTPAMAATRGDAATHIVQLRPGVSLSAARQIVQAAGGRVTGELSIIRAVAARVPARGVTALRHDSRVRAVSVNARVRAQSGAIDPQRIVTAYPAAVHAPEAWASATGAGIGVAVIDTGIDGTRPDFNAADGSSRVIASVVTNPDATNATDGYGHGTHVAGILAGNGANRLSSDPFAGRYVGIAPDAKLISIKTDDGAGNATILDVIYGLQFAVDHRLDYNIRVVNLSLSSTVAESYRTDPLDAAVESAYFSGIVVVTAAGNRGDETGAVDYAPGNDPFAISVGALDDRGTADVADDAPAAWSSRGTSQDAFARPDVVAPGAHIVSALAADSAFATMCPSCIVDDQYIRTGGTSMAAPVVAGVAALVLQRHPDWTPEQVKRTLIATGRRLGPDASAPAVDANAAVNAAEPASGGGAGIAPNELVDPSSGAIDYVRSSWGRSSWGGAPESLVAPWARSSWGCTCPVAGADGVSTTRSSWGRSSWAADWKY